MWFENQTCHGLHSDYTIQKYTGSNIRDRYPNI
jgi:hypothetical protein